MTRTAGALAVVMALGIAVASAQPTGGATAPSSLAATLAAVRDQRNVQLTTTGRRSGKPHTIPVWFVVEGERIYLNTLDPGRDWVRNAKMTPEVRLAFGETVLVGQFRTVTDPARDARIRAALRAKYWVAWAGGLVGQGPKEIYVIEELRPATP